MSSLSKRIAKLVITLVLVIAIFLFAFKYIFGNQWLQFNQTKTTDSSSQCPITLVSALIDIPAIETKSESPEMKDYLSWLTTGLIKLNNCLVLYIPKEHMPLIEKARGGTSDKKLILRELNPDFILQTKWYERSKIAVEKTSWLKQVGKIYRPEKLLPAYVGFMFSKTEFLRKEVEINPFDSKYFFFVDASYGHGKLLQQLPAQTEWPSISKVEALFENHEDQVFIVKAGEFSFHDCSLADQYRFYTGHRPTVSGGFYGGKSSTVLQLAKLFERVSEQMLDYRWFDDDQTIMFSTFCVDPNLFFFYECKTNRFCNWIGQKPCWDSWSCPAYFLQPSTLDISMDPFVGVFEKYISHKLELWSLTYTQFTLIVVFLIVVSSLIAFYWRSKNRISASLLPSVDNRNTPGLKTS